MDVIARIPALPPPRAAAADRATTVPDRPDPAGRPATRPRRARWCPRIEAGSITVLALVAALVWGVVAWRERQDALDARAAVRLARQFETTTTAEPAR